MQKEFEDSELGIRLIAVNGIGYEESSETIDSVGDLPVLQDTPDAGVWDAWQVNYRDVVVLDAAGGKRDVYNLTENDLADSERYEALKQHILAAISISLPP